MEEWANSDERFHQVLDVHLEKNSKICHQYYEKPEGSSLSKIDIVFDFPVLNEEAQSIIRREKEISEKQHKEGLIAWKSYEEYLGSDKWSMIHLGNHLKAFEIHKLNFPEKYNSIKQKIESVKSKYHTFRKTLVHLQEFIKALESTVVKSENLSIIDIKKEISVLQEDEVYKRLVKGGHTEIDMPSTLVEDIYRRAQEEEGLVGILKKYDDSFKSMTNEWSEFSARSEKYEKLANDIFENNSWKSLSKLIELHVGTHDNANKCLSLVYQEDITIGILAWIPTVFTELEMRKESISIPFESFVFLFVNRWIFLILQFHSAQFPLYAGIIQLFFHVALLRFDISIEKSLNFLRMCLGRQCQYLLPCVPKDGNEMTMSESKSLLLYFLVLSVTIHEDSKGPTLLWGYLVSLFEYFGAISDMNMWKFASHCLSILLTTSSRTLLKFYGKKFLTVCSAIKTLHSDSYAKLFVSSTDPIYEQHQELMISVENEALSSNRTFVYENLVSISTKSMKIPIANLEICNDQLHGVFDLIKSLWNPSFQLYTLYSTALIQCSKSMNPSIEYELSSIVKRDLNKEALANGVAEELRRIESELDLKFNALSKDTMPQLSTEILNLLALAVDHDSKSQLVPQLFSSYCLGTVAHTLLESCIGEYSSNAGMEAYVEMILVIGSHYPHFVDLFRIMFFWRCKVLIGFTIEGSEPSNKAKEFLQFDIRAQNRVLTSDWMKLMNNSLQTFALLIKKSITMQLQSPFGIQEGWQWFSQAINALVTRHILWIDTSLDLYCRLIHQFLKSCGLLYFQCYNEKFVSVLRNLFKVLNAIGEKFKQKDRLLNWKYLLRYVEASIKSPANTLDHDSSTSTQITSIGDDDGEGHQ